MNAGIIECHITMLGTCSVAYEWVIQYTILVLAGPETECETNR